MSRVTEWTCDGCGDAARASMGGEAPDGWKVVGLQWEGLKGHPLHRADGGVNRDLCGGCARRLNDVIDPMRWPRAAKMAEGAP